MELVTDRFFLIFFLQSFGVITFILLCQLVQRVIFHALIVFLFNCDLPTKGKHFYSSSESEEEEEAHKKFNIKIKPLQSKDVLKSAATVDELKASIGNIALSPSPVVSKTVFNLPFI